MEFSRFPESTALTLTRTVPPSGVDAGIGQFPVYSPLVGLVTVADGVVAEPT